MSARAAAQRRRVQLVRGGAARAPAILVQQPLR
jgi:hypothetical protein